MLAPRALVAERQTAGRGRLGRTWESTPGASLTFSLAWPFAAGIDLSGLSLAVGVALAETLDPRPGAALRIGLKWPNDLWLVGSAEPGRKLGGVLIETVARGAGRVAVIGIGINLREQRVADGVDRRRLARGDRRRGCNEPAGDCGAVGADLDGSAPPL